ncbi:MAG: hypothetical protein E7372_00065 [Clostridiales bacterium]|nr:hypothetical protein [Clostridiales bacterium]
MKLIKCYISSFGKLNNFTYDFSYGLNTINKKNGWGKSTLATFIKAMFYGLNGSKHSIAENERKKYRPWNSTEKFGGYVEFEWGNNSYKIERFFGAKESEDTVRLFDTKTGKEFNNTENLGKRIFEIDEDGFLSTTYFSQKDFQIKSNSSLTAKYNSLCELEDSKDYDNAIEKLDSKIKKYKIRGDKGLIADTKRAIIDVENEIQITNKSIQTFGEIKKEIAVMEDEVNLLGKQIEEKTKKVSAVGEREALKLKRDNYNKLCGERQALAKQVEDRKKLLGGNITTQEEVNKYFTCNNDLITAKTNIDILSKDIENLKQIQSSFVSAKKQTNILLYVAIISALLGLGMFFVNYIVAIACIVIGALLGVVNFVSKGKQTNVTDTNYQDIITKKQEELNRFIVLEKDIETTIDNFIARFNIGEYQDRFSALNTILTLSDEYKKLKEKLEEIEKYIKDYDGEKYKFMNLDDNAENLADLRSSLNKLQANYNELSTRLASKRASLVYHQNLASNIVELESTKTELEQKLKAYKEEFDVYSVTLELLKKADENLKVRYRAPLQESLDKYIAKISSSDMKAQIDIDLNVSIIEKGGEKDTDFYSKGYQNLIEICKRFALTDVLFKGEKPFIILDDPFYNLDEIKVKNAIDLIKKLSKEYQIIYFICHSSRGSDEI